MRGLSGLSGLFGFRFVQPNRRTGPNRPEQPARSRAARATVSGAGGRFFHPARRARLVNRATLVSSRFPSESRLDGFPLLQQGPYGQQGHAKTGVGPMSCGPPPTLRFSNCLTILGPLRLTRRVVLGETFVVIYFIWLTCVHFREDAKGSLSIPPTCDIFGRCGEGKRQETRLGREWFATYPVV